MPKIHFFRFCPRRLATAFQGSRSRGGAGGLLVLLTLACVSGSHPQVIDIDDHYSMNIVRTPPVFPEPSAYLTPIETEVQQRRGRPDYIRVWWRPDGSLIRSSDLYGQRKQLAQLTVAAKKSWIYLGNEKDNGEEIVFLDNSYEARPLEEKIKLVCLYGDPDERSAPTVRDGVTYETWRWIEHGFQIELADGKESKRTYFAGSGSGTYLGK